MIIRYLLLYLEHILAVEEFFFKVDKTITTLQLPDIAAPYCHVPRDST